MSRKNSASCLILGVKMRKSGRVDDKMLRTMSVGAYFKYIFMTLTGSGMGDRVEKGVMQGEHPNHPLPKTHQSH